MKRDNGFLKLSQETQLIASRARFLGWGEQRIERGKRLADAIDMLNKAAEHLFLLATEAEEMPLFDRPRQAEGSVLSSATPASTPESPPVALRRTPDSPPLSKLPTADSAPLSDDRAGDWQARSVRCLALDDRILDLLEYFGVRTIGYLARLIDQGKALQVASGLAGPDADDAANEAIADRVTIAVQSYLEQEPEPDATPGLGRATPESTPASPSGRPNREGRAKKKASKIEAPAEPDGRHSYLVYLPDEGPDKPRSFLGNIYAPSLRQAINQAPGHFAQSVREGQRLEVTPAGGFIGKVFVTEIAECVACGNRWPKTESVGCPKCVHSPVPELAAPPADDEGPVRYFLVSAKKGNSLYCLTAPSLAQAEAYAHEQHPADWGGAVKEITPAEWVALPSWLTTSEISDGRARPVFSGKPPIGMNNFPPTPPAKKTRKRKEVAPA